jgi:hypothetical protein
MKNRETAIVKKLLDDLGDIQFLLCQLDHLNEMTEQRFRSLKEDMENSKKMRTEINDSLGSALTMIKYIVEGDFL